MEIANAIILGLIEGVTEFLPVSSTGHLLVAEHFLRIHESDSFNVLLQIGPILAVAFVYRNDLIRYAREFRDPLVRDEIIKVGACFCLTVVLGLITKLFGVALPESVLPVAVATLIGGIIILIVEIISKGRKLTDDVGWGIVPLVAIAQIAAAVFPGTSRSGAVLIACFAAGIARPTAVRFAFIVGIPTMLAAGGFQVLQLLRSDHGSIVTLPNIISFITATVTAFIVVKWLVDFIKHHTFIPFAIYRFALGTGLIVLFITAFMR